jgi:hypothetical protein
MVSPFGRRTMNSVTKRKWPVQPESTIAVACCSRRVRVRQALNVVILE